MRVCVRVREASFDVAVGKGLQDFRWLATVAARRYAERHAPKNHVQEFTPVSVTDEHLRCLFPADRLVDHLEERGSVVLVELVGPDEGLHTVGSLRVPTLWEKYAYAPVEEWRAVRFVFDVEGGGGGAGGCESAAGEAGGEDEAGAAEGEDEEAPEREVRTFGNFNRWGEPIPLRREGSRGTRYVLEKAFPPGAEVCFKFVVDGQEFVSDAYEKVADGAGDRMNCFYVEHPTVAEAGGVLGEGGAAPGSRGAADFRRPLDGGADGSGPPDGDMRVVSAHVVGAFEPVRTMTDELRAEMFSADVEKMQFADVVRARADRAAVVEVLRSKYDELCKIFQYFSSHGSGDITFMSVMEWLHFCHVCRLPGADCSTARLDRIFRRVNIEEEFDEDFIEANPKEYRNAMRIVPDPFNPNNQFIRGEFMEALVRAALIKLPGMPPAVAAQKLLDQHVVAHALGVSEDGVRERLLAPAVQQVYRRYAHRLHDLFLETAKLDATDADDTTINLREFEMLLNQHQLMDQDLSRRAAFSAFAMSQDASASSSDDYEMVYGEFLEVLGRLAALKYGAKRERAPASGRAAADEKEAAGEDADDGAGLAAHFERLMCLVFA